MENLKNLKKGRNEEETKSKMETSKSMRKGAKKSGIWDKNDDLENGKTKMLIGQRQNPGAIP